jgi:hypothetical protein
MSKEEIVRNNFESKCSMKIESNSRGFNTTVHVYEGCDKNQIDQTVEDTIYAHLQLQLELKKHAGEKKE